MDDDQNILMKEYAEKYRKFIYRPLAYTGFCRFDIRDNKIVQLTYKTIIYNTTVLLIADCGVGYLLYNSVYLGKYLNIQDALCVIHFAFFANGILLNLTYVNRNSGLNMIKHCMKIDCYLGIKETAFMREIAIRTYLALNFLMLLINIGTGVFLYMIYKVTIPLHFVGSLYFFWLFFGYDDYAFSLMHFNLACIRIRYLNVALIKFGEMNENYVPNRSVFNLLFWRKKYDNMVTFHHRSGVEEFNRAFRMCFEMLALLERYYTFPIFCGTWTVVVGSFVAVQTFIMRVKNPNSMDNEHTIIIVGWVILTWAFLVLYSLITDMIPHQLQQTKLICSYIQLKPNKSAKIYKLTKTVLSTIGMRRHVPNIYNLFEYSLSFVLKIAASTLVYITVQLQLAFPGLPLNTSSMNLNETNV